MNREDLVSRLQESNDLQEKFASMSNGELADLLLEKVWADMELFTYNSELLDVAIERLRSGLTQRPLDGATPEGFCECGISIESHTGVYCSFRPASNANR